MHNAHLLIFSAFDVYMYVTCGWFRRLNAGPRRAISPIRPRHVSSLSTLVQIHLQSFMHPMVVCCCNLQTTTVKQNACIGYSKVWLCDTCWYSGSALKGCLISPQIVLNRQTWYLLMPNQTFNWYILYTALTNYNALITKWTVLMLDMLLASLTCAEHCPHNSQTSPSEQGDCVVAVLSIVHIIARDQTLFLEAFILD